MRTRLTHASLSLTACLALLACEPIPGAETGPTQPDPCAGTINVCDPDAPTKIIKVNGCGQLVANVDTCDSGDRCQDTDPDDPDRYITPRCVSGCGIERHQLVCDDSDTNNRFYVNECGELSGPTSKCGNVNMVCVEGAEEGDDAECRCPPSDELRCFGAATSNQYDPSHVTYASTCSASTQHLLEEDHLVETCEYGSFCYQDDDYNDMVPHCTRSLDPSASDSPYYDNTCTFPMFVEFKTKLAMDCRCRTAGDGHKPGDGAGVVLPISQTAPGNAIAGCLEIQTAAKWREDLINDGAPMGSGVSVYDHCDSAGTHVWHAGALDPTTRELYAPVNWTNANHSKSTTIFAFNIDTGARRVVSGIYLDRFAGEIEHGSGYLSDRLADAPDDALVGHTMLKLGPDGNLYSLGIGWTGEVQSRASEIVRIDPQTGARTLVWQSQAEHRGDLTATYGQCLTHDRPTTSGVTESVPIQSRAFSIGDDGTFHLSFHGPRDGDGVLAISADGATCTFVSRWHGEAITNPPGTNIAAPDAIGSGYLPQYGPLRGMLTRQGAVYLVTAWGDLLKIDLATGNRVVVGSKDDSADGTIGASTLFYDDTRDLIFAIGGPDRFQGSVVDEATRSVDSFFYDHPNENKRLLTSKYRTRQSVTGVSNALANANVLGWGAFVMDPTDNDIFFFIINGGGLVKFERSTFNNYIMSL